MRTCGSSCVLCGPGCAIAIVILQGRARTHVARLAFCVALAAESLLLWCDALWRPGPWLRNCECGCATQATGGRRGPTGGPRPHFACLPRWCVCYRICIREDSLFPSRAARAQNDQRNCDLEHFWRGLRLAPQNLSLSFEISDGHQDAPLPLPKLATVTWILHDFVEN